MDVVKLAGPDHPITLTPAHGRVEARFAGQVIAASDHVLWVKEGGYHAVAYFPRADVEMCLLKRTTQDTYCPYKGHASYFSLEAGGATAENAVWSYETPHPGMEAIGERLAFYPNIVEVHEAA